MEKNCDTINTMVDFVKNIYRLPNDVVIDISHRLDDWFSGGGKENDNYVQQQFKYANRILLLKSEKKI